MLERITTIIRDYTGNNQLDITEDTDVLMDLGLSSFDLVQLVCMVEDEFDIEVPDKAIRELKTVGDVIRFIENQ